MGKALSEVGRHLEVERVLPSATAENQTIDPTTTVEPHKINLSAMREKSESGNKQLYIGWLMTSAAVTAEAKLLSQPQRRKPETYGVDEDT